jgi:putative ABC transport system ATP-binding protein
VLQSYNLISFLTARENVELAMGFVPGRRSPSRARQLLLELGLEHRIDSYPRQLSGGEAQRVAVAVPWPTSRTCCSRTRSSASWTVSRPVR